MTRLTQLLDEINDLETNTCKGCRTKRDITIDHGQQPAHRHCQTVCLVGLRIKDLGSQVIQEQNKRRKKRDSKRGI